MNERPILMSGPMVRAVLEDRKTQTRRVVLPAPTHPANTPWWRNGWLEPHRCPYGVPGDRLWVRETFKRNTTLAGDRVTFLADGAEMFHDERNVPPGAGISDDGSWRPSIFMPRWVGRLRLEIVDVRVQPLQAITQEDALAEGVEPYSPGPTCGEELPTVAFSALWDGLNAKRGFGWDVNPWVWAITFRKVGV